MIACAIDALEEISLSVQKANPDERQAHIARRLAMVAGEDAEPTRVDRETFVETELRAEVGDKIVVVQGFAFVNSRSLGVIGVIGGKNATEVEKKHRIRGSFDQAMFVDALQECLRTLTDRAPERRLKTLEQLARRPIPAIPKIAGQFLQAHEPLRNPRIDLDRIRRPWRLHAHCCERSAPIERRQGSGDCTSTERKQDGKSA